MLHAEAMQTCVFMYFAAVVSDDAKYITSSYEQGGVIDLWFSTAHLFHAPAKLQRLRGGWHDVNRKSGKRVSKKTFSEKLLNPFAWSLITFLLNVMYTLPSSTLTCQVCANDFFTHCVVQPY